MAQDTALQVIELQQLPIIVERLHSVKADIQRNLPVLWTAQSKKPRNWASRRIPRNSWLGTKKNGRNDRKGHFYGNDYDSL